ncbi:MAG TPA: hypothetical protein VGH76_14385 [Actinomycetospora sp.]|uniref:hypothetical protein n=1 Tax=Actinomycetospora sp. TaxID=1872135 RepID=UPI002F3EE134
MVLPVVALAAGVREVSHEMGPYLGGRHWQSLATATVEAVLVVCATVFLVGGAERWLSEPGPRAARWARAAFPAFVIQGPVLLALATAIRFVPAPAEVKAPVVAVVGIVACFWLGGRLPVNRWLGRPRTTTASSPTPTSS